MLNCTAAPSWVPQISNCVPLLFFLIYVNDLILVVKFGCCLLFADDLKIFARLKSLANAARFQVDLDNLNRVANDLCLKLHIDKRFVNITRFLINIF